MGLLRFLFKFFFFWGSLFNFLGDGFVARTLYVCVIKLIYFAIGTLSVFMVEFVSLYFNFFLGFCSILMLLIGVNFFKDFHLVCLSVVYDIFGCVLSGTGYFIDI